MARTGHLEFDAYQRRVFHVDAVTHAFVATVLILLVLLLLWWVPALVLSLFDLEVWGVVYSAPGAAVVAVVIFVVAVVDRERSQDEVIARIRAADREGIMTRCAACRNGALVRGRHTLALGDVLALTCPRCEAIFVQHVDQFELLSASVPTAHRGKRLFAREWSRIAAGGLSDEEQRVADEDEMLDALAAGDVPLRVAHPLIRLRAGEEAVIQFPDVVLIAPRKVRTGGHRGVSVPVNLNKLFATNVFGSPRVHVGRSQYESHDELREVDVGAFVVTTQRVVFLGRYETVEFPLHQVSAVEPFTDALAIRRAGTTRYFKGFESATLRCKIDGRAHERDCTPEIVGAILDGIMTRSREE